MRLSTNKAVLNPFKTPFKLGSKFLIIPPSYFLANLLGSLTSNNYFGSWELRRGFLPFKILSKPSILGIGLPFEAQFGGYPIRAINFSINFLPLRKASFQKPQFLGLAFNH